MITDNDGEFDMAHRITVRDLLPWLAAAGGGVLTFLGYAGFDQFYLEWICLVPILWAIRKQSPVRAFFIGWVAGTVVGWVFEDTIRQVLRAFGVDLGFLTVGQLGATLGFVGAFFRSVVVQKK